MLKVCPAKILSVTFFSNSNRSNVPEFSKLPCNNSLHCLFYPAKWQIFKIGGDSPLHAPIKIYLCIFLFMSLSIFLNFFPLSLSFSLSPPLQYTCNFSPQDITQICNKSKLTINKLHGFFEKSWH